MEDIEGNEVSEKQCKCGTKASSGLAFRGNTCLLCIQEYRIKYYANLSEEAKRARKERSARWNKDHRDQTRAHQRDWLAKQRETEAIAEELHAWIRSDEGRAWQREHGVSEMRAVLDELKG